MELSKENQEKTILSLILETTQYDFSFSNKYKNNVQKLFESAFFSEDIASPITLKDFRNNKYSFLNRIKFEILKLQNTIDSESLSIINESLNINSLNDITINDFINDVNLELNKFQNQSDFNYLDSLNPLIKQTLLFSNKPLKILGYNVNDSELKQELYDKFGINDNNLKHIILNKSDKEIYFIAEDKKLNQSTIVYYSIPDNELNYFKKYDNKKFYDKFGSNKVEFLNEFWKNPNQYINVIKNYLTNNIIEIYRNPNLFDYKFQDNLYGDIKYQNRLNTIRSQNIVK